MSESTNQEVAILNRADEILQNLSLSWKDLDGMDVLDIGSGESALAHAATLRKSTARIHSVDIEVNEKWFGLPQETKARIAQADVEALPFSDESFDLIVNHGSVGIIGIHETVRVLRSGGEMRIYPIGGQLLELWNLSYYLDKVLHWPQKKVIDTVERLNQEIIDADGWRPKEYVDLYKAALDTMTKEQKLEVIDLLVRRYSETFNLPFSIQIKDPDAHEPNGLLIYKKV